MFEDSLDRLLKGSKHLLYTDFLLFFCQVAAVVICFHSLRKKSYSYLLLIYCCTGLLLLVHNKAAPFIFSKNESIIFYNESSNVLFAMIEYVIFGTLFLIILNRQWVKLLINTGGVFMLLLTFVFFYRYFTGQTSEQAIFGISDFLISFELIVLGILCLAYYFSLLRRRENQVLSEIPAFWIVTGLFPYALAITPFFMIMTDEFRIVHEKIYYLLFIFHYISFSFLFICIIRALRCKRSIPE